MSWTNLVASGSLAGLAALAAGAVSSSSSTEDSHVYGRTYRPGEEYRYALHAKGTVRVGDAVSAYEELGVSRHRVIDGAAEEVRWEQLRARAADGEWRDLDEAARRVPEYLLSLAPGGPLELPALSVTEMTGMITDLHAFFVAVSPGLGSDQVRRPWEVFVSPLPHRGEWADGVNVLRGEDCTSSMTWLAGLSPELAEYETLFSVPPTGCVEFARRWMRAPVAAGQPNNFQLIRREGGRLTAMWGTESFLVRNVVDRGTGRIFSGRMENHLTLRMRVGCDDRLEGCAAELPVIIHRMLQLELGD
jgi:hypothetical protein